MTFSLASPSYLLKLPNLGTVPEHGTSFIWRFMLLSQMWKALERSKVRSPSEVVVLSLKRFRGFCSDDFAETWESYDKLLL